MNDKLKSQVMSGLFWKLMERSGAQGIQFIVQIILARLLSPEEFGIVVLITIFISLANVFVQSGFNRALIQKKEADEVDFSSVFYLNLFIATVMYCILYYLAPYIALLYNEEQLVLVIRVLAITLFFGALNSLQNAIVSRKMQFKRNFISSLGGIIISGFVGIVMAYMNYGVWALVAQQIINTITITFILWFTLKWRPQLIFSIKRLKYLFSYGWKLLCASLLDTTYNSLYGLIIGKIYNPAMLGYYNRGNQFPNLIVTNINESISAVMFRALSIHQDDPIKVKAMVRRTIVSSCLIIFPLMVGLAVSAESLVKLLLTDKWLPAVPFLQIMCIYYAFWPIHTANLQAINALGRSDIYLKLEIIKKVIGILALLISIPFGIYAIVGMQALVSLLSTFINSYPNHKLIGYSFKEQWRDVLPIFIISSLMGILINTINFLDWSDFGTLISQIVLGFILYIILVVLFKLESFSYLLNVAMTKIKKSNFN